MTYEEVFSTSNLYDAWRKCEKGVKWKGSVQAFHDKAVTEVGKIRKSLLLGKVKTGHFHRFTIMERGKVRHIQSVHIRERVVQRCLCDNCLVPVITPKLIYDNAACIKGKGAHFAIKRMKAALHRYYLKYGTNEGYILQFDFHHYFDTIPHGKLIEMVSKLIDDGRIMALFSQLVNDFDGDVGLGLGSQISQISALYYPHDIDNRFANDPQVFTYGRYMDDGYVISASKEKLRECMATLRKMAADLGLEINEKKTTIRKFGKVPFEFLKARFSMYENGRIVVRPNKRNICRNRRKLKKLKAMVDRGEIGIDAVLSTYRTTSGNFKNFDAYETRKSYDSLFAELFPEMKKPAK